MTIRRDDYVAYWCAKIRRDLEAVNLPVESVALLQDDDVRPAPRVVAPRPTRPAPPIDAFAATPILERIPRLEPTTGGSWRVVSERVRFARPVQGHVWYTRRCRLGVGWEWTADAAVHEGRNDAA